MLSVVFTAVGRALAATGTGLDQRVLARAGDAAASLVTAADALSVMTEWPLTVLVVLALIAGSWWRTRRMELAVLTVVAVGGAMALAWALKYLVDRLRPDGAFGVISPAFPSAHATRAMVLGVLLTWLLLVTRKTLARRPAMDLLRGTAGLVLHGGVVAVGAARVILGVHWPTDVLAGWAVALVWCVAVWLILRPRIGPG